MRSGVHPLRSAVMTHASSGSYAMRLGLRGSRARCSALRALRGHRRIERTAARPRPRLQAFRPVRPVRVVLIGREPQSAFQLAADRGLVAADPQGYLAHAEPVPVAQFVDPDPFLCRQVGISFHIERSTFSSVVDLNTSNHRAGVALLFRTQEGFAGCAVLLLFCGGSLPSAFQPIEGGSDADSL